MQDTTTSLLLSNLRLLDIVSPDAVLCPQIISSEATLHSLFQALSPEETAKVFGPCVGDVERCLGVLSLLANIRSFAE